MSMITFSENHESLLVAYEENSPLASAQDPLNEGLKWAYSLGSIPTSHVVVVGLGSGFHIAALAELDPKLQITVVDSRDSLLPIFRAQFPELAGRVQVEIVRELPALFKCDVFKEVLKNRSYVLSFSECWGQHSSFFSQIFSHLTGRSLEALEYHFAELGMNIKALPVKQDQFLSIKDILPAIEGSTAPEKKKQVFRALGQLVK